MRSVSVLKCRGHAEMQTVLDQEGLKLNGTHQLLVYADDVNILRGSIRSIQKNTEDLVIDRLV
jgi:hypothetical protein